MADDELFRDDLFPEDNDSFFDELPGEESFFPGEEEDLPFDSDDEGQEKGGVSRTFKILGGVLLVAVLGVVGLVVTLALQRSGKITDNERTSTAVVATNTAVQIAYQSTVTAQGLMVQATENAIKTQEAYATATELAFQTQEAFAATGVAQTATAEFYASQTAEAAASMTAVFEATQSAAEEVLRIVQGTFVGEGNKPFANVTLRLYLDDGDGQFNPPSSQAATSSATTTPVPGVEGVASSVDTITYGQTVTDTLETGAVDMWNFTGTAGDVLTIEAVAEDNIQTDMFLELVGPGGSTLATDDDSGGNFNASLKNFELPSTGSYVIRVNSVTGPGAYTLTLTVAGAAETEVATATPGGPGGMPGGGTPPGGMVPGDVTPTTESGSTSYVPRTGGVDLGPVDVLTQGDSTPQPETGDALINELLTGADGSFDFGLLEAGDYWIELDYDSLSPELQAMVPEGEPLSFQVQVPTTGEPLIIGWPQAVTTPVTPAESMTPGGIEPITATPEEIGTLTPATALAQTGLFDDMDNSSNALDGSNGLMILGAAAVGLVAVVFIARKLRMSS